ncbi:hypothetical protein [Hydrogenibacillus schlegelii]|uniref:hypothetical protein n=1 Tax=Hydrogenibacillus schlegelii TaxID=1484 RepID=UPI003F6278D3
MHAHPHLGLSIANSLAAVAAGATRLAARLPGRGAGAGTTPLYVFAAGAAKRGLETGLDLYKAMDAAEDVLRPGCPGSSRSTGRASP